jgi:glycosyltransferase involved in cell wall biosynthesis
MEGSENLNAISFFIPAYNCANTIKESVDSVMDGNFKPGDELVIVNDGSDDYTAIVLEELKQKYSEIKIFNHSRNLGGGAARNTAIRNTGNRLLFCLDSDNILVKGSIADLKDYFNIHGADVAAFSEIHFFRDTTAQINHKWVYKKQCYRLEDYLSTQLVPGASGNYLFAKESWDRAGGYPENVYALDTWGFGFRQAATGSKIVAMPNSYYYHRCGYDSYWVRESRVRNIAKLAAEIVAPFFHLIDENDLAYIQGAGKDNWFDNLDNRPLKLNKSSI